MSDDALAKAVRDALQLAPCSLRKLEQEAGLTNPTLSRIDRGERGPTRETAERLAGALNRWAARCLEAEDRIRRALEEDQSPQGEP